jgi:hypothetical protein
MGSHAMLHPFRCPQMSAGLRWSLVTSWWWLDIKYIILPAKALLPEEGRTPSTSTSYWKPSKRFWPSSARTLSLAAKLSRFLRSPTRSPFLVAFDAYAGPMPRFVVPICFPASSASLSPSISCGNIPWV